MQIRSKLFLIATAATLLLAFFFWSKSGREPVPSPVEPETQSPPDEQRAATMPPAGHDAEAPLVSSRVPVPAKQPVMERIAAGDRNVFKVSTEQVKNFLKANQTNAESLLAAFNISGDPELLREAASRYPSNAFVLASVLSNDALPEQRSALLEQFKQISPDNPLANYLAASDAFKKQQPEQALRDMSEASNKKGFTDFTTERLQGLEEIYLSAGHSPGEAKALATLGVQEPSLPVLRDLAAQTAALERQYAATGDSASVQSIARLGLGLLSSISMAGTRSLATQLLGGSAERDFLTPLSPSATYDFLPQPVSERLAQLQQDRRTIMENMQFYNQWLTTAGEDQLVPYFDRMNLYGEAEALNWARAHPAGPPR